MRIDAETGTIDEARQVASPNFNARPAGTGPELIVVHGISLPPGEFGGDGIIELFTNTLDPDAHPYYAVIADLRVAAHLLIRRDGELIQFVPLGERAWHAGRSRFRGREECNDFAIGIELEGTDDVPYEPVQYDVLARLCVALSWVYPDIAANPVVGHSDVAPGRKTDPGTEFDWWLLDRLIRELGGDLPSRGDVLPTIA